MFNFLLFSLLSCHKFCKVQIKISPKSIVYMAKKIDKNLESVILNAKIPLNFIVNYSIMRDSILSQF